MWYIIYMKQDKHNQNKAERFVIAVVVLAIIGAVSLAVWAMNSRTDKPAGNETTQEDDSQEEEEPDFSVLTSINSQGVLDLLANKKSGFIYAGRPTCPHCQVFAPILTEVVAEKNWTVYYFNTDATQGETGRGDALDALEISVVPSFVYVKNGKVAARLQDTASRDALIEFISSNQ